MFLSVLMCVNKFNPFLERAIESIINQVYEDFEFIIVVNNCEDEFFDYILSLTKSFNKIKVFRTNLGQLAYNLNFGVENCSSKFIVRMDADDVSLPNRLQITANALRLDEDADVYVFESNIIDENDTFISENPVPNNEKHFRKMLCRRNPIVHPTVCFKKEIFYKVRGYLGGIHCEDYDFWLRIDREKGKFSFTTLKVLNYRVSSSQCAGSRIAYADVCGLLLRESLFRKDISFLIGALIRFFYFFYLDFSKKMK